MPAITKPSTRTELLCELKHQPYSRGSAQLTSFTECVQKSLLGPMTGFHDDDAVAKLYCLQASPSRYCTAPS